MTLGIAVAIVRFHWGFGAVLLVGLLTASVVGLLDGRFSVAAALLCLFSCPILLIADQHAWLQQSSFVNYYVASVGIYSLKGVVDTLTTLAFYLLCIGLSGQIVSYVARGHKHEDA